MSTSAREYSSPASQGPRASHRAAVSRFGIFAAIASISPSAYLPASSGRMFFWNEGTFTAQAGSSAI